MGIKAIYPGSFDPVTLGHVDVIRRAVSIFDEVLVAVATNTQKEPLFTAEERAEMMEEALSDIKGVKVKVFDGLVIDYARDNGIHVLIRGVRLISDFEYEFQMALTNRRLDEQIETVFLMPSEGYSFISSTLLKEAASLGADISSFVPENVVSRMSEKLKHKKVG